MADAMSRVSAFCLQLDETGYDAIYKKKDKTYIPGDINFILVEVHDKMSHRGPARTVECSQRRFDVISLKQKVKDYISKCAVCLELEPRFFNPPFNPLIRSNHPWERLSLDLVGPKKSTPTGNKYFLQVKDNISRFPFTFDVKEAITTSVISAL